MTTDFSSPTIAHDDASAVLCPRCGFDLRGTTSDQCGECGLAIERTESTASNIPWTHRRQIGRGQGFWKTVWRVTIDSRSIRHELARPHEPADATAFRRVVAFWTALAFGAAGDILLRTVNVQRMLANREDFLKLPWSRKPPLPPWLQDVWVPWSAGISLYWVWIGCAVGIGLLLPRWGRTPMRLKDKPAAHRVRAAAMAEYATAPLAWLTPAAAIWVISHFSRGLTDNPVIGIHWHQVARVMGSIAAIVGGAGLFFFFHRSAEWNTRAHHGGPGRYAAGFAEAVGRSFLLIFTLLGIIPWCLGLGWLILESIR